MTLSQILEAASSLTTQEQLALNKALCVMIRSQNKQKQAIAGAKFFPGQVVRFNAKTKGMKMIKIEKFNRAGTAVVGYECDSAGFRNAIAAKWTVATTLCTTV